MSDLQFKHINSKEEINNYFTCKIHHNKLYTKFCQNCHKIYCNECEINEICLCTLDKNKYFNELELNWPKFENHRNKVRSIIMKLISQFYPGKIA